MRISEMCSQIVLVFVVVLIGISTANRTKRQIIFNPDSDDNRLYESDCTTPDRRPGRCIRLRSCTALTQGVSRQRLRRYICGFEGDEPRVCCPQPRAEVTTRSTTRWTTTTPRPIVRQTPRPFRPERTTQRPPRTTVRFIDEEPRSGGQNRPNTPSPDNGAKPPFLPRTCGVSRNTNTRIVGGREADNGSWPWMAVVYVRKSNGAMSPDCGGALVTNRHVVTAAHCVVTGRASRPIDASRLRVRLGSHDLRINNEPGAIDVNVESVRRHEQFDARTYRNDIAVLKLSQPVAFTNRISPVCLPYDSLRNENLEGKSAFAIGYGTTAFNGESSDVLMEVSFDIIEQETCREAFRREVQITRVYMCAGTMDGTKDACQGDSGGPLLAIGKNSNFYLVGVVSFGKSCGQPGYPGVYTRVTEFLDWLTRNLSD